MKNYTHPKEKKILYYIFPESYSVSEINDTEVGLVILSINITPTPHTEYINSLQTLFQQLVNDDTVCIDIHNNVISEIEKIKEDAYMYMQKAIYYNTPIVLPAQNAFIRKIVHGYVAGKPGFKSESVGVGRDRHIVIGLIEK